jgi:hypothetical protein
VRVGRNLFEETEASGAAQIGNPGRERIWGEWLKGFSKTLM